MSIAIYISYFISTWAIHELSFDGFHEKGDRLYQVIETFHMYKGSESQTEVAAPLGPALLEEIPGIENYLRYHPSKFNPSFVKDNELITETCYYVDSTLFQVLDYELIQGDSKSVLSNSDGIVISERMRDKYFPDKNPLGQTIELKEFFLEGKSQFKKVTGVFKNLPTNTIFAYADCFMPYEDYLMNKGTWNQKWGSLNTHVLILLNSKSSKESVNERIKYFIGTKRRDFKPDEMPLLSLQRFDKTHLFDDYLTGANPNSGEIRNIRLLLISGWVLLIAAMINSLMLQTSIVESRKKELNTQACIGATRKNILIQFLIEYGIVLGVAALLSLVINYFFEDLFTNLLSHRGFTLPDDKRISLLITLFLMLGIGFVIIPALLGMLKISSSRVNSRSIHIPVFLQQCISSLLIICSTFIYLQVEMLSNQDRGFNSKNLIVLPITPGIDKFGNQRFKKKISNLKGCESISAMDAHFYNVKNTTSNVSWDEDSFDEIDFNILEADLDIATTASLTLTEKVDWLGKNRQKGSYAIITESAQAVMSNKVRVGDQINVWRLSLTVIGVCKDIHYREEIGEPQLPVIIIISDVHWYNYYMIRLRQETFDETIYQIKELFKEVEVDFPFEFQTMEWWDEMQTSSEHDTLNLFLIFTISVILISSMGLFGTLQSKIERSRKHIAIHKSNGASTLQIIVLMLKDYLIVTIIGLLIAGPLAYLGIDNWLQSYAHRIELSWWVFILAGGTSLLIVLSAIGFQTFKAAKADPVKSLRYE